MSSKRFEEFRESLGITSEKLKEFLDWFENVDPRIVIGVFMALGFFGSLAVCRGCEEVDSNVGKIERKFKAVNQGGKDYSEQDKISLDVETRISPLSSRERFKLASLYQVYEGVANDVVENRKADFWEKIREHELGEFVFYRMLGLMRTESNFEWKARSSVGAQGGMQIMPKTRVKLEESFDLSKDKKYLSMDLVEKDIYLAYLHIEDEFNYVNERLSSDVKYAEMWQEVVNDGEMFELVVMPLIFTGYNQGPERVLSMMKYLFDMHRFNILPEELYEDGKDITSLRSEVVDYLHDRAYLVVKKGKVFHGLDKSFKDENELFGPHGRAYAKKVKVNAHYVKEALFEGLSSKVEKLSDHGKISGKLDRYSDEVYSLGSSDYELVYGDDLHKLDKKLVNFDEAQVPEKERRGFPEEFKDVYLDIVREVREKTGKVPVLNSWCRDLKGVDRTSDKKSFHKVCQAFDWKVKGVNQTTINSYKATLTEYAMDGKLYFKHENKGRNGEHIHVILVQQENQEMVEKGFENLEPSLKVYKSTKQNKTSSLISSGGFVIKNKDLHCKKDNFYRKNKIKLKQCVSMLAESEKSIKQNKTGTYWKVPALRKSVITSVDPRLKSRHVKPGKSYKVNSKQIVAK